MFSRPAGTQLHFQDGKNGCATADSIRSGPERNSGRSAGSGRFSPSLDTNEVSLIDPNILPHPIKDTLQKIHEFSPDAATPGSLRCLKKSTAPASLNKSLQLIKSDPRAKTACNFFAAVPAESWKNLFSALKFLLKA